MHSDIRVVKEALKQLEKAQSWVLPALQLDDIDEETLVEWNVAVANASEALRDWLGEQA